MIGIYNSRSIDVCMALDVNARRNLKAFLEALNASVSNLTYIIDLNKDFIRGQAIYHGAGELEVRPGDEYDQSNIDKLPGSMKTELTAVDISSHRGSHLYVRLNLDIIDNEIHPMSPDGPQTLPEYKRELEKVREVAERFGYKWNED